MGKRPARATESQAEARATRKHSSRKTAANRENAKRSTGPRTPHGKSRSRLNALKHGILASIAVNEILEGRSERNLFDQMVDGLAQELNPLGWREELLVQEIANCYWNKRKLMQYEQDLAFQRYQDIVAYNQDIDGINARIPAERLPVRPTYMFAHAGEGPAVGMGGEVREHAGLEVPTLPHPSDLAIVTRYRTALTRERERLMKELDQLQAKRCGADAAPVSPEAARGGIDPGIGLRNHHRQCQPMSIASTMRLRDMELEMAEEDDREAANEARKNKGSIAPADGISPIVPQPDPAPERSAAPADPQNYETKPKSPQESGALPIPDAPESTPDGAGDGENGPRSTSSG